jgi:hypothetical protein
MTIRSQLKRLRGKKTPEDASQLQQPGAAAASPQPGSAEEDSPAANPEDSASAHPSETNSFEDDSSEEDSSEADASEEDSSTEDSSDEDSPQEPRPSILSLPLELQYLDKLIRYRLALAFDPSSSVEEPVMPPYDHWELPIGKYITEYNQANTPWTTDETRLLLIAMVHHVHPDLFDHSIDSMLKGGGDFPRIGGARGKNFRGFMPTGETALFLLAGDDWKKRLAIQQFFWADHLFATKKILWLEDIASGEPAMSGKIVLSSDYVDIFTHDRVVSPHFSMSFPARLITTSRDRSQLVISTHLNRQIEDLLDWIKFRGDVTKGEEDGKFKKGYRCLFYGPSGTGKTFAACILGKETKKDVYRIDLSMIVSKYIGETEKNLEVLFARAENKKWILFFDEADALFGKRTNIRDAHDKYANQEVSYLLQRIEDYDGLVILATNMKNNIDEAFIRRFNSVLKFQMPDAEERKKIWQNIFPRNVRFIEKLSENESSVATQTLTQDPPRPEKPKRVFYQYHATQAATAAADTEVETSPLPTNKSADIPEMVKKYVLSGGNIENIVHYASIKGAKRQSEEKDKRQAHQSQSGEEPAPIEEPLTIYLPDVMEGIRQELGKDGIPFG